MSALNYDEDIVADIRARLDKPVVLVGLMGTGKTRLGRMLATTLDLPFTDSDDEIEKAAGMSVAEIFDRFGEPYFRDGERRVVKRLLDDGVKIIATGGGAVMTHETADLIREKSISLWIRADLSVMLERTARNDRRPLLRNGDPEKILQELVELRYPVYGRADIAIDSHSGPVESILSQTLEKLDKFLRNRKS
jgi:shikimate kinase